MPLARAIAIALSIGLFVTAGPVLAGGQGHCDHAKRHPHSEPRAVPAGADVPKLTLKAVADPGDGYNLNLVVDHFAFSPERTGQATEAVEGHAHLYINGTKIGRVYGTWVHVPEKLLDQGANDVRVSLIDNTHRVWAVDGQAIEADLVLQGLRDVSVELDGAAAPVVPVAQGERVLLTINGAGDGALHFHGYDLEARAADGQPAVLKFQAHHTGRFPVMTHIHDQVLGDREKALLFVEVRAQ